MESIPGKPANNPKSDKRMKLGIFANLPDPNRDYKNYEQQITHLVRRFKVASSQNDKSQIALEVLELNVGLVKKILAKLTSKRKRLGIDEDDIRQETFLAIFRILDTTDLEELRGNSFYAYLEKSLEGRLRLYFNRTKASRIETIGPGIRASEPSVLSLQRRVGNKQKGGNRLGDRITTNEPSQQSILQRENLKKLHEEFLQKIFLENQENVHIARAYSLIVEFLEGNKKNLFEDIPSKEREKYFYSIRVFVRVAENYARKDQKYKEFADKLRDLLIRHQWRP